MSQKAIPDETSASITEQVRGSTFSCNGEVPIKTDLDPDDFKTPRPIQVRFDGKALVLSTAAGYSSTIQDLVSACAPASFGRGDEDVSDESYSKASKLDSEKFTTSFCTYTTGIIDVITQPLLPNAFGGAPRAVKAELYKLNVYGAPSDMFKVHFDTPCSLSQFGGLVVALPVSSSRRSSRCPQSREGGQFQLIIWL